MRKPLTLSVAVVLSAAGFAAASIVTGGSLAAVADALTGTTETTTTTTSTTPTTGGRRIEICHRHGGKHGWFKTVTVDQHALRGHLRHGDHVGPCTPADPSHQNAVKPHGDDDGVSDDHSGTQGKSDGEGGNHESGSQGQGTIQDAAQPGSQASGHGSSGKSHGQGNH